jgi:hypothetical protein
MYRIGFIIQNKHIFSNGLMQNAYFLYDTYKKLGHACTLLSYDKAYTCLRGLDTVPVALISVDPSEFQTSDYDVLISVGMGISPEVYAACVRTHTHVIGFVCGNVLANTTDGFTDTDAGAPSGLVGKEAPIHAVWMIDAFRHMKAFMEVVRSAPTTLVRHTWSPGLLELFASQRRRAVADLYYKGAGATAAAATATTSTKLNILILEPNLNYVKSAVIPFTICEHLHRRHPDLINEVFVFNWPEASKTADHLFRNYTVSTKTRKFKSLLIDEILGHFNSQPHPYVVLSYQDHNPWNYLYYEMLHFGVPLVHNSPDFKHLGYYYSDTDVEGGAGAVLNAHEYHSRLAPLQAPKIRQLLDSMDPAKPECQAYWGDILEREMFRAVQSISHSKHTPP